MSQQQIQELKLRLGQRLQEIQTQPVKEEAPQTVTPPVDVGNVVPNVGGQISAARDALQSQLDSMGSLPPNYKPPDTGDRTVLTKVGQRLMGSDLQQVHGRDDPIPMTRLGTTVAGAITGGTLGLRVPPLNPLVNPLTGALLLGGAGAVGGAVAPEGFTELGEKLGFIEPGTREKELLRNEELRTVAEGEALVELVTGGLFSGVKLAGRGTSRLLTGPGPEARQLADDAAKYDIELPAGAVGPSVFARFMSSVFGRFPIIASKFKRTGIAAERQIQNILQNVPGRVGQVLASTDLGTKIFKDGRQLIIDAGERFDKQYNELWKRADAANITVSPNELKQRASVVLSQIHKITPPRLEKVTREVVVRGVPTNYPGPTPLGPLRRTKTITKKVRGSAGKLNDELARFIEQEINTLPKTITLRQMDGLFAKIDEYIALMDPTQRSTTTGKAVVAKLLQIRNQGTKDWVNSVDGPNPVAAQEIAKQIRSVDAEYDAFMRNIFESATGQNFATIRKGGLRGKPMVEPTQVPVDKFWNTIGPLIRNSPQAVRELREIVTPETFQSIAAKYLDDIFEEASNIAPAGVKMDDARLGFDPGTMRKKLGLDRPNTAQAQVTQEILKRSSGLTVEELDTVLSAATAMRNVEIPDVSTFVARRAVLGGFRSVMTSLGVIAAPTLAVGPSLGIITAIVGLKGVMRLLADPRSARAWKTVIRRDATDAQVNNAVSKLIRVSVNAAVGTGKIEEDESEGIFQAAQDAWYEGYRSLRPRGESVVPKKVYPPQ